MFKSVLLPIAAMILACTGCPSMAPPADDGGVTQAMRDACPLLTDEVLEGFLLAISELGDDGLSEEDALVQWAEGCESIPPDGNFQGDVEACRACLPVLVQAVYAEP